MYKGCISCRFQCLGKLRRCDASKCRNAFTVRVKLSFERTEYTENEGTTWYCLHLLLVPHSWQMVKTSVLFQTIKF